MKISRIILLLSLLILCFDSELICQDEIKSDVKREEIQRYVGYETLIYRYLSLPYDVTMNINERGTGFLDIGYLLLMFLPILFMIKMRDKWAVILGIPLLMVIILIVSTSNSFVFDNQTGQMLSNTNGEMHFSIDNSTSLTNRITKGIYNLNNRLYQPFKIIASKISGPKDRITYPFILLIFTLLFSLWLFLSSQLNNKARVLVTSMFLLFTFYWFILSPGIVWYGFLGLVLGFIVLVSLVESKPNHWIQKAGNYTFFSLSGIWIIICIIYRMSNVNPGSPPSLLGKSMLNPVYLNLLADNISEDEAMDMFYPGTSQVMNKINTDKRSMVYRIGTSFSYFIDNNNERVFFDNQLQFFNNLIKVYPDKRDLASALKASNFGYLIIDLNTPTLDNTPEKSLISKYEKVINFVYQNPRVQLLATNRTVTKDGDGSQNTQRYYDMFGSQILSNGTFAIYKLL